MLPVKVDGKEMVRVCAAVPVARVYQYTVVLFDPSWAAVHAPFPAWATDATATGEYVGSMAFLTRCSPFDQSWRSPGTANDTPTATTRSRRMGSPIRGRPPREGLPPRPPMWGDRGACMPDGILGGAPLAGILGAAGLAGALNPRPPPPAGAPAGAPWPAGA